MKAALQNHHARMQQVLNHIERYLDNDLDLDALSNVAAYSNIISAGTATFGLSVHRYYPACPHEARFIPARLIASALAMKLLTLLLRSGPPFVDEGRKVMYVDAFRAFL